ncbi:MAG TPA: TlpA disulfide reductase family protein [Bacteroidia bacterium]|nr:TlpA disulfide reductase family protein [Bacteroidia bacterium]HNT79096.1 TlpA disulfide reductase family protein [Bacteroidia bacterium]
MKKLIIFVLFLSFSFISFAQESESFQMPSITLKDMDGNTINTSELKNDGKPLIISFWATWCKPCVNELSTIAENYSDWQDETGVKLIAISIDNSRTSNNVKPFVNGKSWDYEVLLDVNGDFKRAMNVNTVPHTFLFDGNMKLLNQHTSYAPGDEIKLYEKVKSAAVSSK